MIFSNGSISSFDSGFIPKTTSPYICTNLLYESQANLGFPVFFAKPSTATSFNPKFNTVSIIPGIETLAPDLTETNRGFSLSPNFAPIISSTCLTAVSTSSFMSFTVSSLPTLLYSVQTSVVIVNPGGTGTPTRFISAKLAPFPPKRFFIVVLPSAFLSPKV